MDDYEKFKGPSVSWAALLFKKLEAQPTPTTLEEALVPIRRLAGDQWDEKSFTDKMENFELCLGELLRGELRGYNPEFAKAIHAYTLEVPSIYKMCNREMMSSDRRGEKDDVSEGVQAVLGFYKLLMSALMHLPESYRHREKAYRGVKWIYPSPEDHQPEKHFETGTKMLWLEMKSTSRKFEVMHKPHFCGLDGPRTVFTIRDPITGFRIEDFSDIDGEFEVLFPPLSVFEIVETTKQWDQAKKRGFPDMVLLQQTPTPAKWDPCKLFPDVQAPTLKAAAEVQVAAVPAKGPDAGPSPVPAAAAAKAKGYPTAPQAKGPNLSPTPVPTAPAAKAKGYPTPSTPAQDSGGDGLQELLRPRALTTTIKNAHGGGWFNKVQSVMAICPVDGEMFATAGNDSALRLWRLGATGPEAVRAMKGHSSDVWAVAKVSPEVICSASRDDTAKLWEVSSGRSLATLQGHTNSVRAVAVLGPELLATGSGDRTVKLWQLPGGTCSATLRGHEGAVNCLAAVTPELLVSGSDDRTVRLWDAAKAQSLGTWRGHEDWVFALAALAGSTVASGSWDKTVKTWDVATGSNVLTLRGHAHAVCALQVLGPQALASGGVDTSVRIWDLRSGKCAEVLQGHTGSVRGLAQMGKVLLSCAQDGTIRAWT